MTEEEVREYRRRLADPEYMKKAVAGTAERLCHELERNSGDNEPEFYTSGKVPVRGQEE